LIDKKKFFFVENIYLEMLSLTSSWFDDFFFATSTFENIFNEEKKYHV